MIVAVLASGAFAFIGPPTAGLNQGQWSEGGNYSYSTQDVDTILVSWHEVGSNTVTDPNLASSYDEVGRKNLTITDLAVNRYYGRIGYGLSDDLEFYVQLGLADVKGHYKYKNVYEPNDITEGGINFDNDFTWGIGTKYTFYRKDNIALGVALQYDAFGADKSWKYTYTDETYTERGRETTEIDVQNLIVALGPTVDFGRWQLYGGALFSYLVVDHSFTCKGTWTDSSTPGITGGSFYDKETGNTSQNNYGGYIGGKFDICKKCNLGVEYQANSDGWGLGASVDVLF
jgi:hypothetical protein